MSGTDAFVEQIADAVFRRIERSVSRKRVMDLAEAAEYLGMSEDGLRHKVTARQIPTVKIDRKTRFDRVALDRFIEDNQRLEE